MDITELQSRLTELEHLLPSQREWVERLLFQLAFNDVNYIEAVGAEGSGKSTLALALAELFSEQYNVALVSSATAMPELANQLMQQWFAVPAQADMGLQQQIAQRRIIHHRSSAGVDQPGTRSQPAQALTVEQMEGGAVAAHA